MEVISVINGSILTLSATDASGVAATYYSTDGSYPTLVYTAPLQITQDCILRYYSVDNLGNTEIDTSVDIRVLAPSIQTPPSSLTTVANIDGTDDFMACGVDGNFYKSKAGGAWKQVGTSTAVSANAAILHIKGTSIVLICVTNGVWKSENFGELNSFVKMRTHNFGSQFQCAYIPESQQAIFTIYSSGGNITYLTAWGSTNYATWSQGATVAACMVQIPGTLVCWNQGGSTISTISNTGVASNTKALGRSISNAQILPKDANIAFIVGIEATKLVVYKTTNAFTSITGLYTSPDVMTLQPYTCSYYNPLTGVIIIAAAKAGKACLVRSIDDGLTWTEEYYDLTATTSPMGIAASATSVVVVGKRSYKSLDQGDSWPSI